MTETRFPAARWKSADGGLPALQHPRRQRRVKPQRLFPPHIRSFDAAVTFVVDWAEMMGGDITGDLVVAEHDGDTLSGILQPVTHPPSVASTL